MKKQTLYGRKSLKRIQDYPDILTVEETGELLGVSTKTVYKLIKEGEIKTKRVGRAFRIPKSNVTCYLGIECKLPEDR